MDKAGDLVIQPNTLQCLDPPIQQIREKIYCKDYWKNIEP